jgi:alkyl hydroperoxide reductase subunit AhpF
VQVKNAEGTVLKSQILPIETHASDYDTPIRHLVNAEDYAPFDNGTNTIHIYVRLSNGELLEAFNTILKAG